MTKAIPRSKKVATLVVNVFVEPWIALYGIPNYILADKGLQFVSRVFGTLYGFFGLTRLITTTYKPGTNGRVEMYKKRIVTSFRHYVPEHQDS